MKIVFRLILFLLGTQIVFSQASINRSEVLFDDFLKNENIEKREAFKAKSISKVEDLYSYLNIIGNTDFEIDIRNHTATLVKKIFVEEATVSMVLITEEKPFLVNDFLEILLKSKEKVQFKITDIQLESNTIHYALSVTEGTKNSTSKNTKQTIQWAYKTKLFGNKSREVLSSTLGSIDMY